MAVSFQQLTQLYLAFLGRPPDFNGVQFYTANPNATVASVAAAFSASPESQALYGTTFGAAQINAIYRNLFNRDAEPAGLTYWSQEVASGRLTAAMAAYGILVGAQNTDATTVANKLTIATAFYNALDTSAEIVGYSGTAAATSARNYLATVTSDPATVTAAQAGLAAAVQSATTGGAGSTLVLTTGVDVVTGTSGNDTIDGSRAVLSGQVLNTLGNADSIDGGAGTDTLAIQMFENLDITPGSIKNVEVVSVELINNNAHTLSLVNADGSITTIRTANNVNALTVSNIQSAVANYEVSTTAANFTASVTASKLSGTADAATLKVSNVANGTNNVTIDIGTTAASTGYETISVESGGTLAANLVTLAATNATGLTTVNASGAVALTLNLDNGAAGGLTAVTKVDASAMTAALTLTVDADNTQNMTITGGKGNDVLGLNGTYTSLDVINGGDGTDRLVLTNAEATGATTVQTNVSNIEVIGLSNGLNGTLTASNFGATGVRFGANMGGNSTVAFAAGTNSLDLQTFTGANNDLTVNVAGTATNDVLNLTVGSTAAGNTFGANSDVTINGAETVNLLSQGGANTFAGNAAGFVLTDTAATQSIIITGSQSISFGTVRADVIDASAMTGTAALTVTSTGTTATTITGTGNADTVTGSTAGDIINGGAGGDTIANRATGTNSTAGDVLTGGAGFDTFILRGDVASGAIPAIYNSSAQITDFTVGSTATTTDILSLSATAANYSGVSAFAAGVATAAAGSTSVQTVAQNAAATGYVAGTDLIKLTTGIATTGLTAQQAFNSAIGTASVTGLGATTDIFVSFYDTTNGRMVVLVADSSNGTDTIIETGDTVTVVGSITMSAADYASFNANNLAIIAA